MKPSLFLRALLLACLFMAGPAAARADGLQDLRTALVDLKARDPIRARLTQESSGQFRDEGKERTRRGRASIVAEDGGVGQSLRLIYDDDVLAQADRDEAGHRNQSSPGEALRELSALRVRAWLRAADNLLEDLTGAEVVRETSEAVANGNRRVLELKLRPPRGLELEKGLKVARTGRIWIDERGLPASAEIRTITDVRRLIFKVRFDTTETTEYGVAARRLIVRRQENRQHWKAWILFEGSNQAVTTIEPL